MYLNKNFLPWDSWLPSRKRWADVDFRCRGATPAALQGRRVDRRSPAQNRDLVNQVLKDKARSKSLKSLHSTYHLATFTSFLENNVQEHSTYPVKVSISSQLTQLFILYILFER